VEKKRLQLFCVLRAANLHKVKVKIKNMCLQSIGVVNVQSNVAFFGFFSNCPSLETSGSTKQNQATLTTPKHAN